MSWVNIIEKTTAVKEVKEVAAPPQTPNQRKKWKLCGRVKEKSGELGKEKDADVAHWRRQAGEGQEGQQHWAGLPDVQEDGEVQVRREVHPPPPLRPGRRLLAGRAPGQEARGGGRGCGLRGIGASPPER